MAEMRSLSLPDIKTQRYCNRKATTVILYPVIKYRMFWNSNKNPFLYHFSTIITTTNSKRYFEGEEGVMLMKDTESFISQLFSIKCVGAWVCNVSKYNFNSCRVKSLCYWYYRHHHYHHHLLYHYAATYEDDDDDDTCDNHLKS